MKTFLDFIVIFAEKVKITTESFELKNATKIDL